MRGYWAGSEKKEVKVEAPDYTRALLATTPNRFSTCNFHWIIWGHRQHPVFALGWIFFAIDFFWLAPHVRKREITEIQKFYWKPIRLRKTQITQQIKINKLKNSRRGKIPQKTKKGKEVVGKKDLAEAKCLVKLKTRFKCIESW
jgi:hypothetical protein